MSGYWEGYIGIDIDDLERLHSLASSRPERRMTFDQAYATLDFDPPRDVAERAWNDFCAYYTPKAD